MTDDHNYLGTTDKSRLSADIGMLMFKGAGYAALGVLAIVLAIWLLVGIGSLLPPESKEAPDPTPTSAALIVTSATTTT